MKSLALDKLKAEMAMGFPPTSATAQLLVEENQRLREALEAMRSEKRTAAMSRESVDLRSHEYLVGRLNECELRLLAEIERREALREALEEIEATPRLQFHRIYGIARAALSEEPQR